MWSLLSPNLITDRLGKGRSTLKKVAYFFRRKSKRVFSAVNSKIDPNRPL